MAYQAVTLKLPEEVYERVKRNAKAMKQPVEQMLEQIVQAGIPSLEDAPLACRPELEAMESLSDKQLWQETLKRMPEAAQRKVEALLRKNRNGSLTEREQRTLQQLRQQMTRLMLRRSYAFVLLKYRGHVIPALAELPV